jgi:hypothetical protein
VTLDAAVAAAARMSLASLAFAEPASWWGAAMADWVAAFEPIADATGFEVDADADLTHLRWRLTAPAATIAARSAAWFDQLGLGATPVALEAVAAIAGGPAACGLGRRRRGGIAC